MTERLPGETPQLPPLAASTLGRRRRRSECCCRLPPPPAPARGQRHPLAATLSSRTSDALPTVLPCVPAGCNCAALIQAADATAEQLHERHVTAAEAQSKAASEAHGWEAERQQAAAAAGQAAQDLDEGRRAATAAGQAQVRWDSGQAMVAVAQEVLRSRGGNTPDRVPAELPKQQPAGAANLRCCQLACPPSPIPLPIPICIPRHVVRCSGP